jgi:hypothetical protein
VPACGLAGTRAAIRRLLARIEPRRADPSPAQIVSAAASSRQLKQPPGGRADVRRLDGPWPLVPTIDRRLRSVYDLDSVLGLAIRADVLPRKSPDKAL